MLRRHGDRTGIGADGSTNEARAAAALAMAVTQPWTKRPKNGAARTCCLNRTHTVTNVWSEPPIRGEERLKDRDAKCLHANQKPLRLFERIILASSDSGDVV